MHGEAPPTSFCSLRRPSAAEVIPHQSVHPRPLAPLEHPPISLKDYPSLAGYRGPAYTGGFSVSTHILPAAYPRHPSDLWVAPPLHESSEQQQQRIQDTVAKISALKEAQESGRDTPASRREILWTVANRYVANNAPQGPGALTLVLLHGIGCHKETWEPVLQQLFELSKRFNTSLPIREIWALDCVQHGDSALLNEPLMGDTFDCVEYARDVTNFLLWYVPGNPSEAVPTNLPRVSAAEAERRKREGIRGRTIVGIGHSLGACAFVFPAVEYPKLFSSLVLVEAFVIPEYIKHLDAHRKNEALCLRRRWLWSSREEAIKDIPQRSYYRQWDRKAIDAFTKYALVELPGGGVRTKAHPVLEATMLFERRVVYEAWEILEKIPPSIRMHWVWGGKSGRASGPSVQAQTCFRRAQNSTNDFHAELGHMLPQEAPDLLAYDIFRFIASNYCRDTKSRL